MKEDIKTCKKLNCDGVVTGILLGNGEIDETRCAELVQLAYPMPVAFHRAFDRCNDLQRALEKIIALGFVRILTSGAAENAFIGRQNIAGLVEQANGRIEIMPGAGINPTNIAAIKELTGARTFHSSARIKVKSKMHFKNPINKTATADEYQHEQTSTILVKQMIEALH